MHFAQSKRFSLINAERERLAATAIQAGARSSHAHRLLLRLKQQQLDACLRLQSAARRRAAATERWRRQHSSKELRAATILQRFVRGKQIRRLFGAIMKVVELWQACTKAKVTTRQFQVPRVRTIAF